MAMPSVDKTWQFNVNQGLASSGTALTDVRNLLLSIKNSLKGFSSSPWVVEGSSDGAGAGAMDGNDRWTDISKLVWNSAGSNHSWIVLRQTGLGSLFEICIDLNLSSVQGGYMTFSWATTGYSGGSGTTAPTATGQVTALTTASVWGYNYASTFSRVLHVMMSTDGQCTRVFNTVGGTIHLMWLFETAKNPISAWTTPVYVSVSQYGSLGAYGYTKPTYDYLSSTTSYQGNMPPFQAKNGSNNFSLCFSGEGYASGLNQPNQARYNQINSLAPVTIIGLVSPTPGYRGRHGQAYDMWWGTLYTMGGGWDGTWPDDSTRKFWNCGALIIPWTGLNSSPGVVPLISY